jgi:serine/threonine protein kinase
MEELEPLVDNDGNVHRMFSDSQDPVELLYLYYKLLLDCLYGLHLLHDRLGMVHADISPSNIMFSKIDGLWKLIDFNHSMKLEKSATTSRIAGTDGFVAPEGDPRGLFTPASDVFALGRVMQRVICPEVSIELTEEEEFAAFDNLIATYFKMCQIRAENRPTVEEALKRAFLMASRFPFADLKDPVLQAVRNLVREKSFKEVDFEDVKSI